MSDLNNAFARIQDMLSTPDGQKQLEEVLGSVMGAPMPTESASAPPLPTPPPINEAGNILGGLFSGSQSGPINADSLMKIKTIMDGLQMDNDPRVNLLTALRPYISSSRGQHIDHAIRLMSISKLPTLLKTFMK